MVISKEDVSEFISNLSVLELFEPVKELEEKFDVFAVPVMVAGDAVAGDAAAATKEKTELDIVLADGGAKKIEIIKTVCALAGLGLKEAKDAIEQTPSTLKEGMTKADTEGAEEQFGETDAKVELK